MRSANPATTVKQYGDLAAAGKQTDSAGQPETPGFDVTLSTAVASNGERPAPVSRPTAPLTAAMLDKMHRYWRAANYLCIGQIYLFENPLLREPLKSEQIKPRLLGHWGTSPGQNLIYVHLNRLIKEHAANVIYISGPGHGGPSLNANSYLEGTYTEVHPEITLDEDGLRLMFRKFSTPGGVPSHCGPHVPNSMHEGGELGYSLVHAFGAAFDNPGFSLPYRIRRRQVVKRHGARGRLREPCSRMLVEPARGIGASLRTSRVLLRYASS
jgi:hypothetical protein